MAIRLVLPAPRITLTDLMDFPVIPLRELLVHRQVVRQTGGQVGQPELMETVGAEEMHLAVVELAEVEAYMDLEVAVGVAAMAMEMEMVVREEVEALEGMAQTVEQEVMAETLLAMATVAMVEMLAKEAPPTYRMVEMAAMVGIQMVRMVATVAMAEMAEMAEMVATPALVVAMAETAAGAGTARILARGAQVALKVKIRTGMMEIKEVMGKMVKVLVPRHGPHLIGLTSPGKFEAGWIGNLV